MSGCDDTQMNEGKNRGSCSQLVDAVLDLTMDRLDWLKKKEVENFEREEGAEKAVQETWLRAPTPVSTVPVNAVLAAQTLCLPLALVALLTGLSR